MKETSCFLHAENERQTENLHSNQRKRTHCFQRSKTANFSKEAVEVGRQWMASDIYKGECNKKVANLKSYDLIKSLWKWLFEEDGVAAAAELPSACSAGSALTPHCLLSPRNKSVRKPHQQPWLLKILERRPWNQRWWFAELEWL